MKVWLAAGIGVLLGFVLGVAGTIVAGTYLAEKALQGDGLSRQDPFAIGSHAVSLGQADDHVALREALE